MTLLDTPFLRVGFLGSVLFALAIIGCGQVSKELPLQVRAVFPDAEPLAHRHRNHSMTEAPDGKLRIYAAQKGDVTDLMFMNATDEGGWSEPVLLDLPRLETNTSPRFFPDGMLYYSSDARHPERPGRKDLNVWRVSYESGVFGVPEVLPDVINTGSHEDGFAPFGEDRAIFSSTTIGGAGGYDLYIARRQGQTWDVTPFPHNTAMADSHPVTTRDGKTLIWYAHLPSNEVYGSVDLFMSHLTDGQWTKPENLGPAINAVGIEYGAGVSADGKTLFFSRDGVLLETDLEGAIAQAGYIEITG